LGLVLLSGSACTVLRPIDSITNHSPALTPFPTTITRISSKIASSSIQELFYYADVVVIGRVVSKKAIVNTARNPSDLSEADSRFYSINQIYQVEFDQILKGQPPKALLVVQNQGILTLDATSTPDSKDIEAEVKRNDQITFIPLSSTKQYLLFLRILDKMNYKIGEYKSTELYAGVAEPWRFEIMLDGTIVPETLMSGLEYYFPSQPLEAAIQAMSEPFTPGQIINPYPPPPSNKMLEGTPYP